MHKSNILISVHLVNYIYYVKLVSGKEVNGNNKFLNAFLSNLSFNFFNILIPPFWIITISLHLSMLFLLLSTKRHAHSPHSHSCRPPRCLFIHLASLFLLHCPVNSDYSSNTPALGYKPYSKGTYFHALYVPSRHITPSLQSATFHIPADTHLLHLVKYTFQGHINLLRSALAPEFF